MTTTTQQDVARPTTPEQMSALIARHIAAEIAGDVDGALAVYTDDITHDVVGAPHGPLHGVEGARSFYEELEANFSTRTMTINYEYYGADFCVQEHQVVGEVPGTFLGVPGQGKAVNFRMLHVFEFRDGLICRENVWLDGGTIVAQLTA